ncbi:outer membrane protein with beta-barrel domain [Dysgonomonas alginatilytica]|uniref:Outer membrane protein with beta-barrel domain n=1 Tax=Dysgonomonas alginatilytica TaxID=1605892 RepID=A0A2V3PTK9_9BACT|nr:porin family protein [Dysgonomonas alginatilytica]PXV69067.1 outer membrane protein with beta-barrel domain [Dysgonomonas alginatilytica]
MKSIYKLGVAALVFAMGLGVSAQELPKFGIEAGINLSNSSWDVDPLDKKARVGFQIGITADYAITDALHLQSGLAFTTKGAKVEGSSMIGGSRVNGEITVNQSYLQLPLYAAYKVEVMPGTKIVFNAGPYFAQGIGGKSKISGTLPILDEIATGDGNVDTYGTDGFLKRFDFGLGAGVGAEFGNIVATIRYELGLVNLSQYNNFSYKNRNAALTLGYRF